MSEKSEFLCRFPFWGDRGERVKTTPEQLRDNIELADQILNNPLFKKWILELEEEYLNPLYNERIPASELEMSVVMHVRALNDIVRKFYAKRKVSELALKQMEGQL